MFIFIYIYIFEAVGRPGKHILRCLIRPVYVHMEIYINIFVYIMHIQYIHYIELLNILFEPGTVDTVSTVHFFFPAKNDHPSQICKKKPSMPVWMENPCSEALLQLATRAFDVI